jgi:hypothetical protein
MTDDVNILHSEVSGSAFKRVKTMTLGSMLNFMPARHDLVVLSVVMNSERSEIPSHLDDRSSLYK